MSGIIEEWRSIKDYPLYSVSSLGRVRSNNSYSHRDPIIMKQVADKDGHMKITLSKNGRTKNFFVHRLVAMAFIPNPNGYPVVNHKDENPSNNTVKNLEWCTQRENTTYNNMPKRRAAPLARPIEQLTIDGAFIRKWKSRSEIVSETGFSGGNITMACQGKRDTAHGFKWRYADQERT